MIGYIDTSLQLQSIMTAHNQLLSTTRSHPCWTISVLSSAVTNDESLLTHWTALNDVCLTNPLVLPSPSPSHIATDGQSVSKSWCRARLGLIYYCWTLRFFLWGALSDERMGLSFLHATGPCQRSLSRFRVPCDSRLDLHGSLYMLASIRGNACKWFVVTKTCLLIRWLLSNRGSIVDGFTSKICLTELCLVMYCSSLSRKRVITFQKIGLMWLRMWSGAGLS
jgi:hypothetical protein